MMIKKKLKTNLKKTVLGVFFVIMVSVMGGLAGMVGDAAYAVPEGENGAGNAAEMENGGNATGAENGGNAVNGTEGADNTNGGNAANGANNADGANAANGADNTNTTGEQTQTDSCQDSLGAIGWLVCPTTGKLAEAVDWLYDKLEGILVINPVEAKDGQPIYEIWKYCLGFTNVVFVIFLLIVVYSQITGVGISNYGIKKSLPKLIVAAIMVNLSFLICSIAVDVSNILGNGIRELFASVEESVASTSGMSMHLSFGEILVALLGGGALTVGAGVVAFESGAIWMLIPVVLGALVAVVVGLITIAMRQAVVILLIMISPLAIVACILPNTEQWFQKWKQLFIKMLVFYPMFSLLFGASALAGFAIMSSATDGFGLLLGVAVQIFPLFFAWSLMKMSGTFLETINAKMRSIAAGPVAASRNAAMAQRQLSKQKHLASGRAYTPSMKLMQFMANKRVASEAELSDHQQTVRNRGLAWRANRHYDKRGVPTRIGERDYKEQADNLQYQRAIARDQNTFNRGLGYLAAAGTAKRARLDKLDNRMVNASDYLKAEQARGERIEYENAVGFRQRMEGAVSAQIDYQHGFVRQTDENGNEVMVPKPDHKFHITANAEDLAKTAEMARYNAINKIMEGETGGVQYVAATAAQNYDTQRKIVETKMQKYFDLTVPTIDIERKLTELTKSPTAVANIDSIIPGLRILNQRGDVDIVRTQIENVLDQGVELGTHASQSLGNFLMFEMKDSDPFLRRFGKYINLETAQVYNQNKRLNPIVTMDEFVTGEYQQVNPATGQVEVRKSKMSIPILMAGTPLDKIERKAMQNLEDLLVNAYSDENGVLDIRKYLNQRDQVETAMAPQFISASLKFLSGSDQIKSLVSFLTGYGPDGQARWESGGDLASDADFAEKYFRRKTLKYLNDQTPSNILGLRSDYYQPLMEHLSKEYEESEMEGWDEEAKEEHRQYMAELAEIQTRYGDLPADEAASRREADIKSLKNKMAGAEFRQLLDAKGKLEQIYRTRTSGAANSAKDWVREWLNLDDENAVRHKLLNRDKRNKERNTEDKADAPLIDETRVAGGFTQDDRDLFAAEIQSMWDDWHSKGGDDRQEFYDESRKYIEDELGSVGDLILKRYEDYHEHYPEKEASELRDALIELVRDPDNY